MKIAVVFELEIEGQTFAEARQNVYDMFVVDARERVLEKKMMTVDPHVIASYDSDLEIIGQVANTLQSLLMMVSDDDIVTAVSRVTPGCVTVVVRQPAWYSGDVRMVVVIMTPQCRMHKREIAEMLSSVTEVHGTVVSVVEEKSYLASLGDRIENAGKKPS